GGGGGGGGIGPFGENDQHIAMALASMAAMVVRNAQLQAEVHRLHLDTIFRLANAAEFRDSDTGAHIQRVSLYCETIARQLGMPTEWCQQLLFAAPMHDVGKLGVADAVLNKPGPLTDEERKIMMGHTTIGAAILKGSENEVLQMAERIAMSHHEKWDGSGYPSGLRALEIPIEGRITAVADVYDALTSKRVYKPSMPNEKAFSIIQAGRGIHFDPQVVDAFIASREAIEDIQEAYSGEQGLHPGHG
ncbi:MAG TPA: HD domain-containing phosphohydrolase, partial [Phycisphaerales bacterium]|nr:HD domain-containing phosphohydrolase [Phycisphaerales bacterium]